MLLARRIIYRIYRIVSSERRRLRRRLTRPGQALLGGLIVTGLLSLDLSGSLAYQAFLMMLCLLGIAFLFARRFRTRFAVQRLLPRFATVGVPLQYRVVLRNEGKSPQKGLLLLEDLADPRPGFDEFLAMQLADERRMRSFSVVRHSPGYDFEKARVKEAQVPPLDPGRDVEVPMELLPIKRGLLSFNSVTLARPDPMGLVKAFSPAPLRQSLLVLPQRYLLPPISLPGVRKYQPGGMAQATSVGESEEFMSLRDYRAGDPWRRIHWRSWARVGKPIVKEYQDEFFVRHALILDTFAGHPYSPLFEEAVSVAASFACTVQTQESLLDLLFVGTHAYCFTSGRGLAHTDQMLEVLAAVRVCYDKPFRVLETLVLNHISTTTGCIVILVDWDGERRTFVTRLQQLGIPVRVLLIREPGAALVDPGPFRDEPDHFHVLELGAVQAGLDKLR